MIQAIKHKVIVDPIQKPTETESGIFVGKANIEGSKLKGIVVSVGDQVRDVKVGDKIIYDNFTGNPLEYKGKKYTIMYEGEVLAVYEQ